MDSTCPKCESKAFKRNGYTRHGKQNHRCLDCGRQFSMEPHEAKKTEKDLEMELTPTLPASLNLLKH